MIEPRHAKMEDLLWMADLSSLYTKENTKTQILEIMHGMFGNKFMLVWDNIGYVIFSVNGKILFVDGIAVVPDKLGSIYAGKIGQYIIKIAKDCNCKYIKGIVSQDNPMTGRLINNKKYDIMGYVVQREVA